MIEHLEKIGKIEQTRDYHIYRINGIQIPQTKNKGTVSYNGFWYNKNNEVVGANFFFKMSYCSTDTKHEEFFRLTVQNILIEQGLDFIFLIKIIELILYNVYMRASLYK